MDTNDYNETKVRRYSNMKSILDFGMGIIYIGVGIMILLAKKMHLNNEFADSIIGKGLAVIVIIYGAWRIYRGVKKDYFIEK